MGGGGTKGRGGEGGEVGLVHLQVSTRVALAITGFPHFVSVLVYVHRNHQATWTFTHLLSSELCTVQYSFTSTAAIRLTRGQRRGAQDGHLDFHTPPELWVSSQTPGRLRTSATTSYAMQPLFSSSPYCPAPLASPFPLEVTAS